MNVATRIESSVRPFIFKKSERSDSILRHSLFCGSLLPGFAANVIAMDISEGS